jgi:hypothetical protein
MDCRKAGKMDSVSLLGACAKMKYIDPNSQVIRAGAVGSTFEDGK